MNFSNDFVTPDEILADVLRLVDDEAYVTANYGFYVNQMQYALQELAFDTFFDKQFSEIPMSQDLRMPLPFGAFNIREVYVYNGDMCNISSARKLWWKRNYWTGGKGFVARDRGTVNNDPFYANRTYSINSVMQQSSGAPMYAEFQPYYSSTEDLLYYNIQNGIIMVSEKCKAFQKLFIAHNGIGVNSTDVPCIPIYLREAVKLWVADIVLTLKISKSITPFEMQKWNLLRSDVQNKLNGRTNRAFDGAWYQAELRVKSMDTNARQDLKEYFARLVK